MKTFIMSLTVIVCTTLLASPAPCQEDTEGATDIPYFTRMPGFYLDQSNNRDFDRYTLYDGAKLVPVEGRVYQSEYRVKDDVTNPPSDLQILRNYSNAITSKGGSVLFEGSAEGYDDDRDGRTLLTGRFRKDWKEIWVEVFPAGGEWLRLTVVEKQAMRQDITAGGMLEALTKDGHVALDVRFDTGKAVIREESRPIISQIVTMLEGTPSLNLRIEGHTDDVGEPRANKKLSEFRARAVRDAIVAEGIAADRLTAVGFGQEKPVGDNGTEEGRAKNRRVELVKQ